MRLAFFIVPLAIALMSPISLAFGADPQVEKRISEALDYVRNNPTAEQEVTRHPKKPKQPFSRLFNISLSSRAYLQLMTDPSKDQSSSAMLEKVADYYLSHKDQIADPDSSYWAGEYHSAAVARFGVNGTVRKGAISRDVEKKFLAYMVEFLNAWSRLEDYDLSLKYNTYYYWNSENHWWQELVTSWGYLLSLKEDPDFKNTVLADGKTVQEHYDRTAAYLKEHMRQRAKKGFLVEISSGGYAGRMHSMYLVLSEISPDQELRALATKTLDLWWTFWAEEQISVEQGGGKVRHRELRGLRPFNESHQSQGYYYFGLGPYNIDYMRDKDAFRWATNYLYLLSAYRPAPFVRDILEDRKQAPPYAILQRRVGKAFGENAAELKELRSAKNDKLANATAMTESDPANGVSPLDYKFYDYDNGGIAKYSWVSPNFVLGTNMRPPIDVKSWVAGSAQGWWHGLLVAGENPTYPERVVPTLILEGDMMGDQYAIQSKGSFMARRLNDAWGKGRNNEQYPMGIYVSKGLQRYTKVEPGFIFIESPKAWVAVRAAQTDFLRSDEILTRGQQEEGSFYRLRDGNQPVIIEAAEQGDYANFDAFRRMARAAALVYQDGTHRYESLSGSQLTMFDDRTLPMIGGMRVNYTPRFAYKSRYVSSDWDSGIITITVGELQHVLDFTAR